MLLRWQAVMLGIIIIQIEPLVFFPVSQISLSPSLLSVCLPVCPKDFCTVLFNDMCHYKLIH